LPRDVDATWSPPVAAAPFAEELGCVAVLELEPPPHALRVRTEMAATAARL
jgi:hypothetical protein